MSVHMVMRVIAHFEGSDSAFRIMTVLAEAHGDSDPTMYMETLADRCQMAVRTVQRHVRALKALGYVAVQYRQDAHSDRNLPSRYTITLSCPPGCEQTIHRPRSSPREHTQKSKKSTLPDSGGVVSHVSPPLVSYVSGGGDSCDTTLVSHVTPKTSSSNPPFPGGKGLGPGSLQRTGPPNLMSIEDALAWVSSPAGQDAERDGWAPGTFRRWLTTGSPSERFAGVQRINAEVSVDDDGPSMV